MRLISLLFFINILNVYSQSETVAGEYTREWKGSNGESLRKIILNLDGTFLFHTWERHDGGLPPERNFYAKGSWKLDKKIISFSTNINDLNDKYTLNFNKTKARFNTRSPRDRSNRDIKTCLFFYDSEFFRVKL